MLAKRMANLDQGQHAPLQGGDSGHGKISLT